MPVLRRIAAFTVALLVGAAAHAAYPERPIRIIVPFAPGGAVDSIARIVADRISGPMGQPVVVENRPGAGSVVGTGVAAQAAPDGYTLLLATASAMMINPLLQDLPYEPMKAFVPVTLVGRVPFLLVANPKLPAKNLKEFIAYAKANPNSLSYASGGPGTPHHIAGETFKLMTGTDLVHVPYKGTAPGVTDVISGNVALMAAEILATLPHVRAGRLRVLGIATAERSAMAPEVPTLKEEGLPGLEVTTWYGVVAPAGVPAEIRKKLSDAISQALTQRETREKLEAIGVIPAGGTPEQFGEFLQVENNRWTKAVRDARIPRRQ